MRSELIRFGCHLITYGSVKQTLRYTVLAEKSGFDTVTIPDHLFHPLTKVFLKRPPWEAFTVMAVMASRTKRVRLMPAVSDSVRRHPALLAHTVATLDHISGGRVSLGMGAGEAFNIVPLKDVDWGRPYTRFREALSLVKALWSSTKEIPTTFNGNYFKIDGAYQSFKPLQKLHPPHLYRRLWSGDEETHRSRGGRLDTLDTRSRGVQEGLKAHSPISEEKR